MFVPVNFVNNCWDGRTLWINDNIYSGIGQAKGLKMIRGNPLSVFKDTIDKNSLRYKFELEIKSV